MCFGKEKQLIFENYFDFFNLYIQKIFKQNKTVFTVLNSHHCIVFFIIFEIFIHRCTCMALGNKLYHTFICLNNKQRNNAILRLHTHPVALYGTSPQKFIFKNHVCIVHSVATDVRFSQRKDKYF